MLIVSKQKLARTCVHVVPPPNSTEARNVNKYAYPHHQTFTNDVDVTFFFQFYSKATLQRLGAPSFDWGNIGRLAPLDYLHHFLYMLQKIPHKIR